jgi:hypothetical protein
MKIKWLILLCTTMLSICRGYSQENRFIEIKVTDTVELKPQKIYYEIKVQKSETDLEDTSAGVSSRRKKANTNTKQIINLLQNSKTSYRLIEGEYYTITPMPYQNNDSTVLAILNSESELKNLYHTLLSFQDIYTHITGIEHETPASNDSVIYTRLYAQAKKAASSIANALGNSLGSLISIEEDKSSLDEKESGGWTIYPPLSSLGPSLKLTKEIYKKVIFRFQLK